MPTDPRAANRQFGMSDGAGVPQDAIVGDRPIQEESVHEDDFHSYEITAPVDGAGEVRSKEVWHYTGGPPSEIERSNGWIALSASTVKVLRSEQSSFALPPVDPAIPPLRIRMRLIHSEGFD